MSSKASFSSIRLSNVSVFFNIAFMLPIRKEKNERPMNYKVLKLSKSIPQAPY